MLGGSDLRVLMKEFGVSPTRSPIFGFGSKDTVFL